MTSRISLGVVGLNADWFESLEPMIGDNPRLSVAAFYDDAPIHRQLLPRGVRSRAVGGLQRLLHTPGVRALVCCSLGWRRHNLIEQVLDRGLPLYLSAQGVDELGHDLTTLVAQVEESGAIVCPDLSWRYTPATLRLRELMAVRIGPCREIELSMPEASAPGLRNMLDWCRFVTGQIAMPVAKRLGNGLEVRWDRVTARLIVQSPPVAASGPESIRSPLVCVIRCELGQATITGEHRIEWNAGADSASEDLREERSRVGVNLDLFLRRVVGGLVPAPTLADVLAAESLLRSLR